jgi:hypothetical protein
MLIQAIIILFLIAILASLGSASYYLLHLRRGVDKRMVKALTVRISLSLMLFLILMVAFAMGWITPHGQ